MVKQTSPNRRAAQAEETRVLILGAARRLFATQGYAATSLKEIALDAGVSVQTVYDSVGGKADLVRRLNDRIDQEAELGEIAASIATETDPVTLATIPARVTRRLLERCGEILRACVAGAQAEPALASVALEGDKRHRAGAARVAARLHELGALRLDLSLDEAARSIAVLADFRVAIVLRDAHDLSFDEIEHWIADTTTRSVLAETARRRARPTRRPS